MYVLLTLMAVLLSGNGETRRQITQCKRGVHIMSAKKEKKRGCRGEQGGIQFYDVKCFMLCNGIGGLPCVCVCVCVKVRVGVCVSVDVCIGVCVCVCVY